MRIEKMYRKNRFKRWVLLSMGILGLMLLAGIFSALDHRVDYGGMETAEPGWTRALTEGRVRMGSGDKGSARSF